MRKVAVTLTAAVFMTTAAFGGNVNFNPPTAEVNEGEVVNMDISFESPSATAILFTLNFDGGAIAPGDFVFDGGFAGQYFLNGISDVGGGNIQVEGFGFTPNNDALVGRLTIDTTGLDIGQYTVLARGEAQQADTTADSLEGQAIITVVPEPATLVLLGIGGVAAAMRRRTA